MTHVLAVRPDGMGDVLLTGPAVRAIAARAERVTMWCGPAGAPAARRLPGVDTVLVHRLPWIDADPEAVDPRACTHLVAELARARFDEAIVFTSFHQSALPTALLLRLAGVPRIGAISTDYPGSLLDVRHVVPDDTHEVERALSLVAAMGYPTPRVDDTRLRVDADTPAPDPGLIAVHPGASAPARTLHADQWAAVVARLGARGASVTVTGAEHEHALVHAVAAASPLATPAVVQEFDDLAAALASAAVVVVGNTGPAHLAAALGRPVVWCAPPTVPAVRWHPWQVPYASFCDHTVACAGCRARTCPLPAQICRSDVDPSVVARTALAFAHDVRAERGVA